MLKVVLGSSFMLYTFVIERPDGSTYIQKAFDVWSLIEYLGDDYWVVDIFND